MDIPDKLEKQFRLKTAEEFGSKKGDLYHTVEEAVKTWTAKKEKIHTSLHNYNFLIKKRYAEGR